MEITYELIGYITEDDFNERIGVNLIDNISSLGEAVRMVEYYLPIHSVIKVQSSDREEIELFR